MSATKKAVCVVMGTYRLDPDNIEALLVDAVKSAGFTGINHLRIIPEGSPVLRSWANRQLDSVDGARLSVYESKLFGGPIRRNNTAIRGGDSCKGKAHLIIQLGPIPPHDGERASTQESLLHYWHQQDPKKRPKIVQVDMAAGGVPMSFVEPEKWSLHESDRSELKPPPRRGASEKLTERSSGFWSATK